MTTTRSSVWVLITLILSKIFTIPSYMYFVSSTNIFQHIQQKIPFIRHKNKYTPLIFFTLPKGLSPICDQIEKVICQVEKECNVQVQRLDILRHPENEAVLLAVTNSITTLPPTIGNNNNNNNNNNIVQPQPPLLYHRESRQIYQVVAQNSQQQSSKGRGTATTKSSNPSPSLPTYIDKDRIRAWAKGRYLSPSIGSDYNSHGTTIQSSPTVQSPTPMVDIEEMDPVEALIDEMGLSSEQLKGKRLMQERTKAKSQHSSTKMKSDE
jgi:hypothetical protein